MEEKEKNITLEEQVKRRKNLLAMAGYGMILAERVLFPRDRNAEIGKISRKKDGILLFSMVVIMYASLFIMYRLFIV